MKFAIWILFIALLITFASAGIIPEEQYLPPVEENEQVAVEQPLEESAALAEDGYRYKTVRKLRHRRDVSELFAQGTLADDGYHYHAPKSAEPLAKLAQEYLPPVVVDEEATENKEVSEAPKVSNEYLPPPSSAPETEEATEKKEIVEEPEISREYLPPTTEAAATLDVPKFAANEELPSPSDDDAVIIEGPAGDESSVLADDGYHYRRIRYRRDVSEIVPSTGYSYETPVADSEEIKSAEVKEAIAEPSVDEEIVKEYLPPVAEIKEAPETAELADDGYRYKTIRKLKYRQRRDVSEILDTTPVDQEESISEASVEYLPPVAEIKEASETGELAEDGYRYKTIRKLKYRLRRDVSEIVAPESATLDKEGYHYRIPEPTQVIPKVSNEYLPPPAKLRELPEEPKEAPSTEVPVPSTEVPVVTEVTSIISETTTATTEAAPIVTETTPMTTTEAPSTTEIPAVSNEYLPPVEEVPLVKEASSEVTSTTAAPIVSNQYLPPVEEIAKIKEAPEVPEETAVLADDGYHYKVGKRFRIRRDVSEIVAPENGYAYEAPAADSTNEAANIYLPPVAEVKEAASPQIASEYLPPVVVDEESKNDAEIVEAPEESAVLADDGYHYKTVRRLKYRNRRDVSEIDNQNGYLYPQPAEDAAEESVVLADDGYRYKTIRRLKYRHRRDVSELVNAPVQDSAIFAEDGYHYKAPATAAVPKVANEYLPPVEDNVAEIKNALNIEPTIAPEVSNEYLPPSEAAPKEASSSPSVVSNEYLPPVENNRGDAEIIELPQESAVLADDGYRYKTVRRIRYRHRRDVSELADQQQADGYTYNAPIEVEPQEIQYLPPIVEEVAQVKEADVDTATLADDGYRYKTVKRIRYRHRV